MTDAIDRWRAVDAHARRDMDRWIRSHWSPGSIYELAADALQALSNQPPPSADAMEVARELWRGCYHGEIDTIDEVAAALESHAAERVKAERERWRIVEDEGEGGITVYRFGSKLMPTGGAHVRVASVSAGTSGTVFMIQDRETGQREIWSDGTIPEGLAAIEGFVSGKPAGEMGK